LKARAQEKKFWSNYRRDRGRLTDRRKIDARNLKYSRNRGKKSTASLSAKNNTVRQPRGPGYFSVPGKSRRRETGKRRESGERTPEPANVGKKKTKSGGTNMAPPLTRTHEKKKRSKGMKPKTQRPEERKYNPEPKSHPTSQNKRPPRTQNKVVERQTKAKKIPTRFTGLMPLQGDWKVVATK